MVLRGFIFVPAIPFQKWNIEKYAPFHIYKFPFIILPACALYGRRILFKDIDSKLFRICYHFHVSHSFREMNFAGIIKRIGTLQIAIRMHFGDILQTCSTFELKNEQIQVTNAVLHGHHVFASLPTGFGKSECFLLLPTCKDVVCSLLIMHFFSH